MTEPTPAPLRPGRPCGGRAGAAPLPERGAVTAEYAVLLPAVVLVLVAILMAGAASVDLVRAQDAAASAARILARGDDDADAAEAVRRMAGDGARWTDREDDGWVTVTVTRQGPGLLRGVELSAEATAPVQQPPLRVDA